MPSVLLSQYCLPASLLSYPAIFWYITPRHASPIRIVASRESLSIFHCCFVTVLSITCLYLELIPEITDPWRHLYASDSRIRNQILDSQLPIITTKSEPANAVTAIETGYLIQDSFILLYAWFKQNQVRSVTPNIKHPRSYRSSLNGSKNVRQVRGLNFLHLTIHHLLLGAAFVILQFYISRGRERGILIIVMLLLMNASSPFGTVRWFLINFYPERKQMITAMTLGYLTAFAVCRVYLIYWILEMFGRQQFGYGKWQGAWDTFISLRPWCMLGTGSLAVVNSLWLANGLRGIALRIVTNSKSKIL